MPLSAAEPALTVYVLWGANPEDDLPSAYPLPNLACLPAFLKGVDEANGWMEAKFVVHGNFRVNKEGAVIEGKAPAKPVPLTDRHVIWGENPESGTKPTRYSFATAEEAQAFELGATESAGWMDYQLVPGPEYRMIPEATELRDLTQLSWLSTEGRARLLARLEEGALTSPLFAMPNGDWADEAGERQVHPEPAARRRRRSP
jgi:hypothetical protein